MPREDRRIRWLVIGLLANAAVLIAIAAAIIINPQDADSSADPRLTNVNFQQDAERPQQVVADLNRRFDRDIKPFLETHCYKCHGDRRAKGDIKLSPFGSYEEVAPQRTLWRQVANNLHVRAMPPEERPQPSDEEIKRVTDWIDDALAFCDCSGPIDPGRVTIRRLNRTEYNNTIRDLVGVDFKPAENFPADDLGHGFDNIADTLTMSQLLAEKYLDAAEQVLDKATDFDRAGGRFHLPITGSELETKIGSSFEGNAINLWTTGDAHKRVFFERDGEYRFRIRARGEQAGDEKARMELRIGERKVQQFEVESKSEIFETTTELPKGRWRLAVAFLNDFYDPDHPDPRQRDRNLIIESVEVEGPLNIKPPDPPDSYHKLFAVKRSHDFGDEKCSRLNIKQFAQRAFRRPLRDGELDRLLALYQAARDDGDDYEQAVLVAMQAVLVSPHFLFRIEDDSRAPDVDANGVRTLNDYELASRLSYFLWSSMPDDELFDLAAKGELGKPDVLRAQVRRMIADQRIAAFIENFTGQWLELRSLDQKQPDPGVFPDFDPALREDMKREGELLFANVLNSNGHLRELIDADYTFVNERLAKHYGINDVTGDQFKRVSTEGTARGGILTLAGVLTVTSQTTRTSPVLRGKWVMHQILGTPPPPPPPDVPELPEETTEDQTKPLRERLTAHAIDRRCASCHQMMDPIGFAMEHFDATGRWREMDGRFEIDDTATLPDGTAIVGAQGLKEVLANDKYDDFVNCFTEKLLVYALGRGLEYRDTCGVREIIKRSADDEHKLQSLIIAIVESDLFRKRNTNRESS